MNQPNTLSDDFAHPAPDELPIDRPRSSGFVLQKIDVPAVLDVNVLDSFLEEDEAEQRETFEYLKRALDETRVAHGERPSSQMSRVILLDAGPLGIVSYNNQ